MPVTMRWAVLGAALFAVGCSGSGSGGTTGGGLDAGSRDAGSDAGQYCAVVDAGCSSQLDCTVAARLTASGSQPYACVNGACDHEAGFGAACIEDEPFEQVSVILGPAWGTNLPKSFELRAFYPFHVDGSPVGCADVTGRTLADGGTTLDGDPTLNVEERGSYPPNCGSTGSCQYVLNTSFVRNSTPVILVQGYSGGQQTDGLHSAGQIMGEGCVEGTKVTTDSQNFNVTVSPP